MTEPELFVITEDSVETEPDEPEKVISRRAKARQSDVPDEDEDKDRAACNISVNVSLTEDEDKPEQVIVSRSRPMRPKIRHVNTCDLNDRQQFLDGEEESWEEKKQELLKIWCKLLIFSGCSRKFVTMAIDLSEREHKQPGEIFLKQGQYTDELFFVEKGVLILVADEKPVWTIYTNECASSLAILGLQHYSKVDILAGPDGTRIRKLNRGSLLNCAKENKESGIAIDKRTEDIQKCMATLKGIDFFKKNLYENAEKEINTATSDHFVLLIAERISRHDYKEGQSIVKAGEEGDDMYIIEQGECVAEVNALNLSNQREKSRQTTLATSSIENLKMDLATGKRSKASMMFTVQKLSRGDVFGELGLLHIAKIRSASIRVVSPEGASALRLRRDDLRMVMHQFPEERQSIEEYVQELASAHLMTANSDAQLSSASYFKRCQAHFCEMLESFCERRVVLPRELIVQEGMDGDGLLYVVHKGRLDVELLGKVIAEISEGDCFGEATMLGISPKFTASIRTQTLTSLMILPRDIFEQALNRFPEERQRFHSLFQARILKEQGSPGPEAHAFFQGGDSQFLQRIQGTLHLEVFMPDQVIVSEGDMGTSMYILTTGKAQAEVRGIKMSEYEAGAVFGELTLLGIASRRTATIKAVTVCIVDILHQHVFQNALKEFPKEQRRFEELARSHLGQNCDYSIYSWPFFKSCPSRFLYLLDIHLVRLVYFTGTAIVDVSAPQKGENGQDIDWSSSMLTLIQGKAAITEHGHVTQLIKDGDVFGEMAILGIPTPLTTTVVARTMCDIQVLRKEDVDAAFVEFPEERMRLMNRVAEHIARKVRLQQENVEAAGSKSLRRATIFHQASPDFLEYLYDSLESRLFMPGTDIVTEGEMSEPCMYILQSGVAIVLAQGIEVKRFDPGNYFGEVGLFGASTKRTATVRAKDPCVVQVLHKEQYLQAQDKFPNTNSGFLALQRLAEGRLGSYLRRMIEQLPLFAESDPAFLDALCDGLEEKTFAPGEIVMREEDPVTDSVMVLVSGSLTMYVGGVQMGDINSGELVIFGEVSGLGIGKWRPATLMCGHIESCLLVQIDQSDFKEALADHPKELARIQTMDEKVRQRASKKLRAHRSWLQAIHTDLSRKVTFFSCCSKEFLWELVELISETCHPPKAILAEDRQKAESMIVLLEGTADVLVDDIPLGKLRAGAVFGDENVLGFPWRTATLQAHSACRIVTIQSNTFWEVLKMDDAFAKEKRYFEGLRNRRAEVGARLQAFPAFMRCEPVCLQQVALRANLIRIPSGQVWIPGEDLEYQGEAFSILVKGNACIELEGLQVLVLTPGSIFADKIVRRNGGVVHASTRSLLYSLRRHDLSAAVLHFQKAQPWFDIFCSNQNEQCRQLRLKLNAQRTRADAYKPHPKDPELKSYAKIKDFYRKTHDPKMEYWGQLSDRSSQDGGSPRFLSPRKEKVSPRSEKVSPRSEKASPSKEKDAARQDDRLTMDTTWSQVHNKNKSTDDLFESIMKNTAARLAKLTEHPLRNTPRTKRKVLRQSKKAQQEQDKLLRLSVPILAQRSIESDPPERLDLTGASFVSDYSSRALELQNELGQILGPLFNSKHSAQRMVNTLKAALADRESGEQQVNSQHVYTKLRKGLALQNDDDVDLFIMDTLQAIENEH